MSDTSNRRPQPRLPPPPPDTDPLAYAKAVHDLEAWLRQESKNADEAAWRYGKERGMNETAIGAAIGRTAQHVYKVKKRVESSGSDGPATP